jgi:DUF3072 family protein
MDQRQNPKVVTGPALNLEKDSDEWVSGDEPMTGAQASYLKTLSEEAHQPDASMRTSRSSVEVDRCFPSTALVHRERSRASLSLVGRQKLGYVEVFRPDSQARTANQSDEPYLMICGVPDRRPSCPKHFN